MNTQSFFNELSTLIKKTPKPESQVFTSVNCISCDTVSLSKNLTYCFDTHRSSDSVYLFDCFLNVNCIDGDYNVECEGCYDSVDCFRCFDSAYLQYCGRVNNSYYSAYCNNCTNIFGCAYLNNKSFCLFNRQLTEQQYKEEIKKYKEAPPEKIFAILNELIKKYPKTQSAGEHNVNSPYGNYLYQCKNCYMCFDSANNENCYYGYDTNFCKSCIDTTYAGQNVENSYQIIDSQILNNCNYIVESNNCQDSWYLFNSKGLKNCFGCVGLQYKQYCILNRQFTEEQYNTITKQLIEELSKSSLNWSNLSN